MNNKTKIVLLSSIVGLIAIGFSLKFINAPKDYQPPEIVRSSPKNASNEQQETNPETKEVVKEKQLSISDFEHKNLKLSQVRYQNHCRAAIVASVNRKLILYSKDAQKSHPIASMTKLLSVITALDIIEKDPALTLQSKVKVTLNASQQPPFKLGLKAGDEYKLEDLFRIVMLSSVNDGIQAIAEGISKDNNVNRFLSDKRRKAKTIGMTDTKFLTVHGYPLEENNRASCEGMLLLACEALKYKDLIRWTSLKRGQFKFADGRAITRGNTNKLVHRKGVIGLKTGFTNAAGRCLCLAAKRGDETIIVVGMGFPSSKYRDEFVGDTMEWAFKKLKEIDQ